ncbi:hypothetical protein EBZ39_11285, partial [bacterium]|nr:hypothetical protein [bacterium]
IGIGTIDDTNTVGSFYTLNVSSMTNNNQNYYVGYADTPVLYSRFDTIRVKNLNLFNSDPAWIPTGRGGGTSLVSTMNTKIYTPSATGFNYTYAQSTDVPNPSSPYSAKVTQSAGGAATSVVEYALRQVVEMSNALQFVGKLITVSFWYKSSIAGTHGIRVVTANMTGGTDVATTFTVASANTWQYITATFTSTQAVTAITGAANGAALYLDIGFRVGGSGAGQTTVPASAYFNLSQVQLEVGSKASAFERRPYSMELQMCQRYYFKAEPAGSTSFKNVSGFCIGGQNHATIFVTPPVTMRVSPNLSHNLADNQYTTATPIGTQWTFVQDGNVFVTKTGTALFALHTAGVSVYSASWSVTGRPLGR